jgi:toxin ParE1/3/4
MNRYVLTNKAVEDLSRIWDYTFDAWSESQADNYYFELLEDCQELCENQGMGKNYVEVDQNIYGFRSGKHIIFYRSLSENEIEIVRILHSRMDLESRIQE